jgi:hypothetical protein
MELKKEDRVSYPQGERKDQQKPLLIQALLGMKKLQEAEAKCK